MGITESVVVGIAATVPALSLPTAAAGLSGTLDVGAQRLLTLRVGLDGPARSAAATQSLTTLKLKVS
jgi:hypothetical protein